MNRLNDTSTYSCGELGVCQGRTPACSGCTVATSCTGKCNQGRNCTCSGTGRLPAFAFAPGVIDQARKPAPTVRKWLLRWVWFTVAISLVSLVAGYLS